MAGVGRTVRVSGLPTNIQDDKLKDKLLIHFLRARNGGGDIDSITIVKATPGVALITFEDSRVAQKVTHGDRHYLDVDGNKYNLTVLEHQERLDPDQVIPKLSATVDYTHLPGGIGILTSVCKNHCDIDVNYNSSEGNCIISGTYSKVQALLEKLFGRSEGLRSAGSKKSNEAVSGVPKQQGTPPPEWECQRTKTSRHKDKKKPMDDPPIEYNSSVGGNLTPGRYKLGDIGQTESAGKLLPSTSIEDLSVIVDADMYQYVKKHYQDEYRDILTLYDVTVVDVTHQGVTTLYLEAADEETVSEDVSQQEHLKMTKHALSMFFKEKEAMIFRDQFSKVNLSFPGELKRTLETLSLKYPNVLFNEDDQNLYLIGSNSEVSLAKWFLLEHSVLRNKGVEGARDLKLSSYPSSLSTRANDERVPLTASSIEGLSANKREDMLRSDEDERRADIAGRYKVAAKFKDLGATTRRSQTADFTSRVKPTSGQSRPGPMLGYDVLSTTSKISDEGTSRAGSQNAGGDNVSKEGFLPSIAPGSNKIYLTPERMDVRSKTPTSISTTRASLSERTVIPPAGSGDTLKRSNSFSGSSHRTPQVTDQRSEGNTSKSKVSSRRRSSSFSRQTPREKSKVHTEELTVLGVLWQYLKHVYKPYLDDLTSDVQMTESNSEKNSVTVTIRGATSSKVAACQGALQQLVRSVDSDFSVQHLLLAELGVADPTDETLQACCLEVRSRFKKVIVEFDKDNMFLLGPKQLCTQLFDTLHEVFSGSPEQTPAENHSATFSSQENFLSLEMNKSQSISPHFNGNSQVSSESTTAKAPVTGGDHLWQTTYNKDFCDKTLVNGFTGSSSKEDDVINEKVTTTDVVGSADSLENHLSTRRLDNFKSSTPLTVDGGVVQITQMDSAGQQLANHQTPREESASRQEGSLLLCYLCNVTGASVTKCGIIMCSKCQKYKHNDCCHCHEVAQIPREIHGQMSHSKLSISLPGHNKFSTIMITYCIQDGIQGAGHPIPGEPFVGGTFKAYLPDCEETKKLLPRLEKAFRQGLTFTVTRKDNKAKVNWDCIPHKTSLQGGKSENGYPDSTYLKRLSEVLTMKGIGE